MYIINKSFAGDPATPQKHYCFEGDIYSRKTDAILRPNACKHFRLITNVNKLKATLRAGERTSVGCYRLFFVTTDGGTLSFESVLENLDCVIWSIRNAVNDGWNVFGLSGAHEPDEDVYCDHSGERIC